MRNILILFSLFVASCAPYDKPTYSVPGEATVAIPSDPFPNNIVHRSTVIYVNRN